MIKMVFGAGMVMALSGCSQPYAYECQGNASCSSEKVYSQTYPIKGAGRMGKVAAKGAIDGSADPSVSYPRTMPK